MRVGKETIKTYDIHGHPRDSRATERWTQCDSNSLAHLIPCHISSSSKTRLNDDVYSSVWYDTSREGNSQGPWHPRPPTQVTQAMEQGRRRGPLIPCHIWGASIMRVHCSAFEVSFLCSILDCPHQHSLCTHNISNQYKYSTTIVLLPSSLSRRPSSSQSRAMSH